MKVIRLNEAQLIDLINGKSKDSNTLLSRLNSTNTFNLTGNDNGSTPTNPFKVNETMKGAAARNNNPGNIKAKSENSYYGQDSKDANGGWAHFPDPIYGIREWFAYIERKRPTHPTIESMWNMYAPASDGNNTSAYIAGLAKDCNFGATEQLPPVTQNKQLYWTLARSCFRHECGYCPSDETMNKAWSLYLQTQDKM